MAGVIPWFDHYREHGLTALTDRSRRPVRYANQLPPQIESFIINCMTGMGGLELANVISTKPSKWWANSPVDCATPGRQRLFTW
jgi:hypothetical protein